MPRYLVERTFAADGPHDTGAMGARLRGMQDGAAGDSVTWIHSYVTVDCRRSYCIVDSPSPEIVRKAAQRHDLPIDRITEVQRVEPQPQMQKETP